jgi:hypothetical protein
LLRLVRAALAAVYATMLADWRLVEWAEMFTMRAHDAERRSGSAARTHRAALTVPISKVACHSSSSTSSNTPIPTSTGLAALTRMLSDCHRSPSVSRARSTDSHDVRSVARPRHPGRRGSSMKPPSHRARLASEPAPQSGRPHRPDSARRPVPCLWIHRRRRPWRQPDPGLSLSIDGIDQDPPADEDSM